MPARQRAGSTAELRGARRRPWLPMVVLAARGVHAAAAAAHACSVDRDCMDVPNTYCVLGRCTIQVDAGRYCRASSECASYAVFGEAACSAACGVEAECDEASAGNPLLPRGTASCCLGSPANATCSRARYVGLTGPAALAQCAEPLECAPDNVCAPPAGSSPETNWIIGVCVSVMGSVTLNVGLNIQKFAYKAAEAVDECDRLPLYKTPFWLFGFGLFVAGNIANFVSLNYAAQSLITPLGAVGLLSNAVAAPLINKEPIGRGDIVSILFVTAGSVIVVVFSSHQEHSYSLCALTSFYKTAATICLLATMLASIVGIWIFINITEVNRQPPKRSRSVLGLGSGLSVNTKAPAAAAAKPGSGLPRESPAAGVGRSAEFPAAPRSPPDPDLAPEDASAWRRLRARWAVLLRRRPLESAFRIPSLVIEHEGFAVRWLLPFSYATIGGIMGALTVLFAKSSALLVAKTLAGENQFGNWFTYVILLGMAVTSVGQIYYINLGLRNYDALLQVPVYYVVWTVFGVVCGGVYFGEFRGFDVRQATLFFLGIFCVFVGVSFLANRLKEAALDDLDQSDDRPAAGAAAGPKRKGDAPEKCSAPAAHAHAAAAQSTAAVCSAAQAAAHSADGPGKSADGKGEGQCAADSTILKLAKVDQGAGHIDHHVAPSSIASDDTRAEPAGNENVPIKAPAELLR